MTILESLLIAHLLGDWIFQTEWQALNKTKNWWALFAHITVYHLILLGVLVWRMGSINIQIVLTVALLAISHAFLDRRNLLLWIMKSLRIIVTRGSEQWLVIAVDQAIHVVLLSLVAIYLSK
jgi:hypothetical protein